MSGTSIIDIVLASAAVSFIAALAVFVVIYNGFVRLANACDRAWANIGVLLKQRYDEIPNLVAVCRGYMEFEREALERVAEARSAGLEALDRLAAPPEAGSSAARERARRRALDRADGAAALAAAAITDLFALAEAYPALRANELFLELQTRITGLESEIADRREHFNQCVTNYNVRREQIPDVVVARLLGLSRRTLLRVPAAEREAPRVLAASAAP